MPTNLYTTTGSDRARAGTHGVVRALGSTPVSISPPTVATQALGNQLTNATSTITGTLVTPLWVPNAYYPIGAVVLSGVDITAKIQRISSGTSRASYDTTEQALWAPVSISAKVLNPIRWNCTFLRSNDGNGSPGFLPRSPMQTDGTFQSYPFQPAQWSIDFDWYTAAGALEVPIFANGQLRFVIDGQYASASPTPAPATSGNSQWTYVKLSGVTPGFHRVRVEIGGNSPLIGGVKIATGDVLYPPSLPLSASFCILGDSYIEGATDAGPGATGDVRGYGSQTARLLGFSNYVPLGISGSGYTLPTTQKYLGRVADVAALQPDYLLVQGTTNDFSNRTTTYTAEVQAFLAALAALNLKSKIVFSGDPYYGVSSNIPIMNAILKPLVLAAGFAFIDTDDWGPGPAAFNGSDNIHPTPMGHDYIARRMAAALSKQWNLPL